MGLLVLVMTIDAKETEFVLERKGKNGDNVFGFVLERRERMERRKRENKRKS